MMRAAALVGLVFAVGMIGVLHVLYPPSDPVIPQVLS
jgi:hypothetical protein